MTAGKHETMEVSAMRVVGVIAEYNPFHLGHAYHLAQARRAAQADYVVAVMSTCFTQRGDAALLSPGDRARMALACGADAVFALPAVWAVRDAEHFALGGVALLDGLGVDAISFGAEDDDLPRLTACARLLENPGSALQDALHQGLERGMSYPAAMAAAAEAAEPGAGAVLSTPNNQLAVCYLRAMMRIGSRMEAYPIKRTADYHATGLTQALPSATAVRGAVERGDWRGAREAMPEEAYNLLREAALSGRILPRNVLDQALMYRLRTMTENDYHALPDVSEGIEDRLQAASRAAAGREALLSLAKTRRYSYARLSRLCTHALLGITQEQLLQEPLPTAAWLLGFREDARPLLSRLKKSGFPIIGKAADVREGGAWFRTELRAYDLWALGCGLPSGLGFIQGVARV